MKTCTKLITLVVFTCLVTVCSAQEAATPGAELPGGTESVQAQSFPYLAEITGDNVVIRTGAGRNFYSCGKFTNGDKIQVVGSQYTWSKIVPPAGSFSWISMQYVKFDPDDPSFGIVTGDNVRVWAGADNYRPSFSTSLQVKLKKGDKVKLMGEQLDDYYKIAPPSGAYLWVSTDYTTKITPMIEGPLRIAMTPGIDVEPGTDVAANIDATTMDFLTDPNSTPEVTPQSHLEKYYDLQKQIEAEKAKPMGQQDYTNIKDSLLEIANDKDADKAARYSQAVIEQVEGYELALEVSKTVKLQNEQLEKTRERINKVRDDKLSEIKNLGRFAVIGKLENFMTYGPGHYRIVDESDKTICIATPSSGSSVQDLNTLIGKKVGLVGTIEPHVQTAGALVRFNDAVGLE